MAQSGGAGTVLLSLNTDNKVNTVSSLTELLFHSGVHLAFLLNYWPCTGLGVDSVVFQAVLNEDAKVII